MVPSFLMPDALQVILIPIEPYAGKGKGVVEGSGEYHQNGIFCPINRNRASRPFPKEIVETHGPIF
jgi:hypothetical protein